MNKQVQKKKKSSRDVVRVLRSIAEQKFVWRNMSSSFTSVATTWVELDLADIGQGNNSSTRVGNSVFLRSCLVDMVLAQGSAESALDDAYNVIRVVCGRYLGGGLSETPLTDGSATLHSPIERFVFTRGRLVTKYVDKYVPLEVTSIEQGGGDGYCPGLVHCRFLIPLNFEVVWGTDATTYPDTMIILSMISDSAATVNPGVVAGYSLVLFTDI
jgi:hypothetical protein